MNKKALIKELISDFHTTPLRVQKRRELQLPLELDKIIVVTGMRRSGKTSLLLGAIQELRQRLPKESILYLNFEDERLHLEANDLDIILQSYRELYPHIELDKCYFFFDEIQEIEGWEKFVRRIDESVSRHLFVTGSNAKLLGSDIATALRGRSLRYEVFPLSFGEFLDFMQIPRDANSASDKAQRATAFTRYLQEGGFPELVFIPDVTTRRKILQEYFDVMIFKDLIERYHESNVVALKYFLKRVIEGVGSPLSIAKIHNEMKSAGFRIAKNTLHDYLEMAQAVYFGVIASRYDPSIVRRELSEKKVYVIDNGFLTALTYRYSQEQGKLLENLVAIELQRRGIPLLFAKGQKECDFIVENEGELIPLQVSIDMSFAPTKERELAGLLTAAKYVAATRGIIVTLEQEEDFDLEGIHVEILPAWKFLLEGF
ncbi:MAG: hypothetical protein KU37_04000 [Sulfuricurvum sp. PC08-66]|nr:MAG: hypothetical protein KU37_04000 [Sulfuricurvum sp. PC08-66]